MMFFPTFLKFQIHGSPVRQGRIMPCPRSIQCAGDDASIRCKGKDVSHKVVVLPSIVETALDDAVARLLKIKFQTIHHTIKSTKRLCLATMASLNMAISAASGILTSDLGSALSIVTRIRMTNHR